MHIQSACLPCMIAQVEKALKLFRPELTNAEIVSHQKQVMAKFAALQESESPYYGRLIYREVSRILADRDPYFQIRKEYNKKAQKFLPHLREIIAQSPDPLFTSFAIAILGNIIDFGTFHPINLDEEINSFSTDKLAINDYEKLLEKIRKSEKILIIGDNAGEIVFDKLMVEQLIDQFPAKKFIYAVRGGPAINDALLEDANDIGLTDLVEVVEGSASPGIIIEDATPEYQEAFHTANVIISKGQGNFESLEGTHEACGDIYFLLKAKCEVVAKLFGVPFGSLVLAQKS